jgi:hypothetical protein
VYYFAKYYRGVGVVEVWAGVRYRRGMRRLLKVLALAGIVAAVAAAVSKARGAQQAEAPGDVRQRVEARRAQAGEGAGANGSAGTQRAPAPS